MRLGFRTLAYPTAVVETNSFVAADVYLLCACEWTVSVDKHSTGINNPNISWKASQVLAEHNVFVFPLYIVSLNLVKPDAKKEFGEQTIRTFF